MKPANKKKYAALVNIVISWGLLILAWVALHDISLPAAYVWWFCLVVYGAVSLGASLCVLFPWDKKGAIKTADK